MRHTRSHTGNRRSHHALKIQHLTRCPHCHAPIQAHTVCKNCGKYQGREVIDVLKKLNKKEKKQKQKELEAQEAEAVANKPLDAKSLSQT